MTAQAPAARFEIRATGMGATARQLDVLRFIAAYHEAKGEPPSYREIATGVGIASKGHVAEWLDGLVERGLLRRLPGRQRAIEPTLPVAIPRAPDGAPLYFVPAPEFRP